MRSEYQKEVDRLHLSEDLRQQILAGEQRERKSSHHRFSLQRCVVCACAVILAVGGIWLSSVSSTPKPNSYGLAVHKDISKIKLPKTGTFNGVRPQLPQDSYQPQRIDYMGGAGVGSLEDKNVDVTDKKSARIPEALMVYERSYGIGFGLPEIAETKRRKRETAMKKTLAQWPKDSTISLSLWGVDAQGTIVLKAQFTKGEKLTLQEAAQRIIKAYPGLLNTQQVSLLTQHTAFLDYQEEVAIAGKTKGVPALEQAFLHGIWISDNASGYLLTLPQAQDYQELRRFPVMRPKEALQLMKQGGYYAMEPITDISQVSVVSMELVYGGTNAAFLQYLPYVVPVYRIFYYDDTHTLRMLEVPALYPQDLKKLTKNSWYFTTK